MRLQGLAGRNCFESLHDGPQIAFAAWWRNPEGLVGLQRSRPDRAHILPAPERQPIWQPDVVIATFWASTSPSWSKTAADIRHGRDSA